MLAAAVVTPVHVSQVKAHLNGVRVPGLLRFTTLVAKVFGVTMVVSTGLPLGREGPMVHAGAGRTKQKVAEWAERRGNERSKVAE